MDLVVGTDRDRRGQREAGVRFVIPLGSDEHRRRVHIRGRVRRSGADRHRADGDGRHVPISVHRRQCLVGTRPHHTRTVRTAGVQPVGRITRVHVHGPRLDLGLVGC